MCQDKEVNCECCIERNAVLSRGAKADRHIEEGGKVHYLSTRSPMATPGSIRLKTLCGINISR